MFAMIINSMFEIILTMKYNMMAVEIKTVL